MTSNSLERHAADERYRGRPGRSGARRGMTLIELMLVLAILVAVAAVAAPAIKGPLEDFRLRRSAELLRARWGKARVQAMRTGQTMMFRFQTGTGIYEIRPWMTGEVLLEGNTLGLALPAADPALAAGPVVEPEELAEGVSFYGIQSTTSSRDAFIQQLALQQDPSGEWSPPVLFYPDGTSSTLRIVLKNERQTFVMVKLRGLTGVAEVSDYLSAEELAL